MNRKIKKFQKIKIKNKYFNQNNFNLINKNRNRILKIKILYNNNFKRMIIKKNKSIIFL